MLRSTGHGHLARDCTRRRRAHGPTGRVQAAAKKYGPDSDHAVSTLQQQTKQVRDLSQRAQGRVRRVTIRSALIPRECLICVGDVANGLSPLAACATGFPKNRALVGIHENEPDDGEQNDGMRALGICLTALSTSGISCDLWETTCAPFSRATPTSRDASFRA